jgi:small subunit ribosomal protein S1
MTEDQTQSQPATETAAPEPEDSGTAVEAGDPTPEAASPAVEAVREDPEIPVVDTSAMEPGQPAPGAAEVELTEAQIEQRAAEVGVRADLFEESDYTLDEYEEMLSLYEDTLGDIAEGEIVKATVLRKTDNAVILDVGFKSEGSVDLEEFREPETIQPGDEVEVFLEKLEDEQGVVVLSKKKADFLRVWEKLKEAYETDTPVPGAIKHSIKGGAMVDLMGVDAFLPGSQIALRRVHDIDALAGNQYEFKILKLNKRRRNIVVSRRVLLEAEREKQKEQLKTELEVGQIRRGVVKNITDFGAFIDLGGMDGLLHITDMSWGRVGHPSDVCSIGDEIEVKVLDIDWDRERISLGLKQLQPHPWKNVAEKYPVGSRVKGKVVSITNYGAFVELEKGVEGLVHISEMSWTRNVRHPSQLVSIGEEIECVVLRVDEEEQKISLGMKQTEEDPWLSLPAKYPPGTHITGPVRNLTSFGAFVEVEPGIDGLVHISDMSWTRRVQHPSEVVRKGEEVEVVVLNIDPEQKRISLGLKQVEEDPWYELAQEFEPGREVDGKVVRLLDKGMVVDLGDDVEGFVPLSQLGLEEPVEDPSTEFVEGERVELKVLESDPINRRIVLSVTARPEAEARKEAAAAAAAEAEEEAEAAGDEAPAEAGEEPEAEADEEPESEVEEEPEAEADEEPESEADEEPESEADEEPESEAEEEPESEAEEEPEAEADEEPEAEADEDEPEAEADEEPEAEADEEPEAEADEEPEAEADEDEPSDEDEERVED